MDDYRDIPIVLPAGCADNTALDYHQVEIDVEGAENKELLVDLALYKVAVHSAYASSDPPYHKAFANALSSVYLRQSVAKKLVEVNERLKKYGVEVLALDGFRPISLQSDIWNYFIKRGEEVLNEPKEEDLVSLCLDEDRLLLLSSSPVLHSLDNRPNNYFLYEGSLANMADLVTRR